MRYRMRSTLPWLSAASALTALALVTGCGASVEKAGTQDEAAGKDSGHYPVTITNCGQEKTFEAAPERVVTNDVGITEIMFALGLTDHMAGYVMSDNRGEKADTPWSDAYGETEWLSDEAISKEIAVGAKADLVFAGWNYGFNEAAGFTPATLDTLGIDSYLLTESCRSGQGKARGVMSPLDALYTDLRTLGKVFDVEDRAEDLVADFEQRVAAVAKKAPTGEDRPRVFLYDAGQDKPFTSGQYAGPHDIITKAGGDHVMADLEDSWVTVGWETVVERDPEIIVINDYGDVSAEQKETFLKSFAPLKNVSAIKNDRIVVLDYADLVESPRNPAAIETLGAYLREHAG